MHPSRCTPRRPLRTRTRRASTATPAATWRHEMKSDLSIRRTWGRASRRPRYRGRATVLLTAASLTVTGLGLFAPAEAAVPAGHASTATAVTSDGTKPRVLVL